MHKKFEINQTKIKGGCQLGRKEVTYNSKSDLPLLCTLFLAKEEHAIFVLVLGILGPKYTHKVVYYQNRPNLGRFSMMAWPGWLAMKPPTFGV